MKNSTEPATLFIIFTKLINIKLYLVSNFFYLVPLNFTIFTATGHSQNSIVSTLLQPLNNFANSNTFHGVSWSLLLLVNITVNVCRTALNLLPLLLIHHHAILCYSNNHTRKRLSLAI